MKKLFLFLLLILTSTLVNGQVKERMRNEERPIAKIERLEKVKLIEILNLDEETSIRFFARRNDYQNKQKDLFKEREQVLRDLENKIKEKNENESFYKEEVQKILQIERKIVSEREIFLNSLATLLTPQQVAKLTVFEFKLRRELTQFLMGRGKDLR